MRTNPRVCLAMALCVVAFVPDVARADRIYVWTTDTESPLTTPPIVGSFTIDAAGDTPAGFTLSDITSASFTFGSYVADIPQNLFGTTSPVSVDGTVGVSLNFIDAAD